MGNMKVAEIAVHGIDSAGAPIRTVYAKSIPAYAVYRTDERVMVHFADDEDEARAQRTALAVLNPVRGEINGFIDGWRTSRAHDRLAKAALFDRRIADALVIGLQGDTASAAALLQAAKADIVEERTSWARFEYLIFASIVALASIAVFGLVTTRWFERSVYDFSSDVRALWLAAGVGTVGAFFSIAIAIRRRTVLTDLQSRDNAADAILRIIIGAIAAALLICLLESQAVTVTLGGKTVSAADPKDGWLLVVVAAFLAGFSERLVPDLLEKSSLVAGGAGRSSTVAPSPATGAGGGTPPPPSSGTGAAAVTGGGPPEAGHEEIDGCIAETEVNEDEATDDTQLPAATGGVEEAAATVTARHGEGA